MPENEDTSRNQLDVDNPGPTLIIDQGETEGDLGNHDPIDFQAAVSSTDWTVETIINQMRKGRIDLNPTFQRRNAWLSQRKSQLVESVMLRYPIPQIVLAERRDRPGSYFVIDGKQRLLALRQFCSDPQDPRDKEFEAFSIRGLEILDEINGMDWSDIEDLRPDLSAKFENHTIRTVFLSQWKNEDLLLSLFLRLNTGSVALSPQELRQALIPGKFVEWIDLKSGESPGLKSLLGNTQPDRRMVDAELLLRFLSLKYSPVEYRGSLKKFLDDTSKWFNENWKSDSQTAENGLSSLEEAIHAAETVFPNNTLCRKWSRIRFERPFNRALFDVVMVAFADPAVRLNLPGNETKVFENFKTLCADSPDFIQSITATTKTKSAFRVRFDAFHQMISDTLNVDFALPRSLYFEEENNS